MSATYKLVYFPLQGLGEPIRFLLSYGKIDFEDFRFAHNEWLNIKPSMPFGKVPVLEYDGKQFHQCIAICRYVAKKVNLVGSDDLENMEIDAVVDTIYEFKEKIALYHYERDPNIRKMRKDPVFNKTIPFYLTHFEEIAKANNGHFVSGKLTWADIFFVGLLELLNHMTNMDIIANCPNLQKMKRNVLSLPTIQAYIEKRPTPEYCCSIHHK
ncbi:hypothetical protein FQA39_LY05486 [Lamprigera yunnana]|nr:hypothetical protein FQA39_LY05486 [Lamprigera yunnana]